MMRRTVKLLLVLIASAAMTSCTKSKLEGIYNRQESQIDSYLMRYSNDHRIVYRGGASRLVLNEGQGDTLSGHGYVSFYYAGYCFNGSVSADNLIITNHQATAEQSEWNLTDADYSLYEINMGNTDLIQGLRDGLIGVKAGEECEILFSGKFGFGNKPFGIIPANSALLYKIWVIAVTND